MFESQLQTAQFAYSGSIICTVVAILVLLFGPLPIGLFFVVLASATAAAGGWFYADLRGYPPALGLGLGIAFGLASALFLLLLPDWSEQRAEEEKERRMAELRERQRRSKNFEVVDEPKNYEIIDDDE
jgi:membrane protein implicated in regulation of membrane protease activity